MPISEPFPVPEDALEESFIASSGPGGQNVNKVATAVQLRCDVFKLGLHPAVYQRLKELAGSRMTSGGEIVITARTHRTQDANREEALEESFIASSGPGGQNVNKVATAVQLRCDVFKLGLHPAVYQRLKELAGSRMTSGGENVITARTHRAQEANRGETRGRLAELIAKAHIRPQKRVRTKPSRAAKAKRVDEKKKRGDVKQGRGRIRID